MYSSTFLQKVSNRTDGEKGSFRFRGKIDQNLYDSLSKVLKFQKDLVLSKGIKIEWQKGLG